VLDKESSEDYLFKQLLNYYNGYSMKSHSAELFKVLGVDTRVKIIELLKTQGPLGPMEIAKQLGVTPAAVSQHLRLLRQSGLVRSERKGYCIPYSIDEEALEKCGQQLAQVCTCGCKGARAGRDQKQANADLESLQKYQRELQSELSLVEARLKELESK
jgi:predicted transcriptional regulator